MSRWERPQRSAQGVTKDATDPRCAVVPDEATGACRSVRRRGGQARNERRARSMANMTVQTTRPTGGQRGPGSCLRSCRLQPGSPIEVACGEVVGVGEGHEHGRNATVLRDRSTSQRSTRAGRDRLPTRETRRWQCSVVRLISAGQGPDGGRSWQEPVIATATAVWFRGTVREHWEVEVVVEEKKDNDD